MPNRWPTTNGNWSDVTIWNSYLTLGAPTASDDVYANNKQVVIDTDVTVTRLTSAVSASAILGGGRFLLANGITLTATSPTGITPYAPVTSGSLLLISGSNSATIIGNMRPITSGISAWPSGSRGVTLNILDSATVTITGSVAGNSGNSQFGILISGSGAQLNLSGSLEAGPPEGGSSNHHGLYVLTRGSANINGDISFFNKTGNSSNVAILFNSSDTLTITGSIYQQSANNNSETIESTTSGASIYISGSFVLYNTAVAIVSKTGTGGILEIKGPITGSPFINIIQNTSTTSLTRLTGPIRNVNGINAVLTPRIQFFADSTPTINFPSDTFPREVTFYDISYTSSLPTQTDVRSASLYGGSNKFSGSMSVPSSANVRYGVPVDNTTGSATLTPQNIFDYAVSSLTGSNTIGSRLQNISTVQTTAATIAAFKGK
jgi:hypothetical protein